MDDPIGALVFYVAFLFSVTLHEAAHARAALRGGDPTAYHGGQVTLNPLPHIQREPFGTVLVPLLTFINKYDRPGRAPLELLDDIESHLDIRTTPATWPVGIPGDFRGVVDRGSGEFVKFDRTARGSTEAPELIAIRDWLLCLAPPQQPKKLC